MLKTVLLISLLSAAYANPPGDCDHERSMVKLSGVRFDRLKSDDNTQYYTATAGTTIFSDSLITSDDLGHIVSFELHIRSSTDDYAVTQLTGNKIPSEAVQQLKELKKGTRVYVASIHVAWDNCSDTMHAYDVMIDIK